MTHPFSSTSQQPWKTIYFGVEDEFFLRKQSQFGSLSRSSNLTQAEQVQDCFAKAGFFLKEQSPVSATHYFLFITDSFLKSKKFLFPLIQLFIADPLFKERLFPVLMGDVSIFRAGDESKYTKYWNQQLLPLNPNSSEYNELKIIEQNVASFICAIRDTLMPPLKDLLKKELSPVIDLIEKRVHLFAAKHFFFLPQEKNSHFSGRDTQLLKLSSLFAHQSVISLTGAPGIGKTALAIEYAKRSQESFSNIFWLDASNAESLRKSFQALATQLSLSPLHVVEELARMDNFLLIYDNVTDPSLIPSISSAHVILIGQNLSGPDITLESFSREETARYLKEQLGISSQESELLGAFLENHPGNLTKAIAYIKNAKISIASYIEYCRYNQEALFEKQDKLAQPAQVHPLRRQKSSVHDLNPSSQLLTKYQALSAAQLSQELKTQEIQIFLSYCWKPSKEPADQIDTAFTTLGLNLLRDERELRDFASLREFMKKVIREADYTLSLINENYLKSFNCIFEIVTTMQDPHWRSRVFPIILPGTDLSETAIASYEEYWRQEAERLEQSVEKDAKEVAIAKDAAQKIGPYLRFVNDTQPDSLKTQVDTKFQKTLALMLARQEKLEKKGLYRKELFHLPMGRNKNFTGREKEIDLLKKALLAGQYSAITNTGMGGVGKSQLALEYAYRYEKDYKMVYWINAETPEALKASYRILGQEMRIENDFLQDERILTTIKGVLEKQPGWLLIFDNTENTQELQEALPENGGHIIITSRNPNWSSIIALDVFDSEEALTYLQKTSDAEGQTKELRILAQELGCLPLALTQAGAYIKKQNIDVTNYLTMYRQGKKQFLSQKERGYPDSVATTWQISMDKIVQEDPNAILLLSFCSYLTPDNIPEMLIEAWLMKKNTSCSTLDLQEALRVLESYSMISQQVVQKDGNYEKNISLHRLVQEVTRAEHKKEDTESNILLGCDVITPQLGDKQDSENKESIERLFIQGESLMTHAEIQNISDPKIVDLNNKIGLFFATTIFNHKKSIEHLERALKAATTFHKGEIHADVAQVYYFLAVISQSAPIKALEYGKKALGIYTTYYGKESHLDIASVYTLLGALLKAVGERRQATLGFQGAIEEFQQSLACRKKALDITIECHEGENHYQVADAYINLGSSWGAFNALEEAKECYEKALMIYDTYYAQKGENQLSCFGRAQLCNNLGFLLYRQNNRDGAREYLKKALEITETFYKGKNHYTVAQRHSKLAELLQAMDEREEAKKHLEKALEINKAYYKGENYTEIATSYESLGMLLKEQEEFVQSQECYEKALTIRIFRAEMSPNFRIHVATDHYKLGEVLHRQGNLTKARTQYENAIEIFTDMFGENSSHVMPIYEKLATILEAQGDTARAGNYRYRVQINNMASSMLKQMYSGGGLGALQALLRGAQG